MRHVFHMLALIAVTVGLATATPAAQTASLQGDFLKDWAGQKDMLAKIADAMPEGKYGFKATPAQRSFGEHVMHIAQINMMLLQTFGSKVPAPQINMKATSKADVMKHSRLTTARPFSGTDQTMAGTIQGPPWMRGRPPARG